ncbi:uncharacterized protein LOC123443437 isoform X3 [Hordeum vulgare subsp. vulgare]|uniref:Predicted protein n=1 Tax=Hordeum vulgare subsp. vulgare TaxID=112509 RepID=F2EAQ4_HORVV|nr:uncharacterized protein LOC123443437 isoform X3 [Hordeum vulgare subsp. vulgare]BAK04426.1 predicted protein [Hordeum vulgare subsp. vulgare]
MVPGTAPRPAAPMPAQPKKPPHMLVLGTGFVGRYVSERLLAQGWRVSGTCTSAGKKMELELLGMTASVFDATTSNLANLHALQDATHLLISIPPIPGVGDPLLSSHADLQTTLTSGWWTGRRPLRAPPTPPRAVCRRPAPTTMTLPSRWWPLRLGRWGLRTARGATACIAWLVPLLPAWVAGVDLGTAARETATTREGRVQADTGPGRTSSFAAAPRVLHLALRLRSAVAAYPRRPGADRGSPRAVARGLGGPLRQLDASRGHTLRAPLLQGLPRPRAPPLRPPSSPLLRGTAPAGKTRSRSFSGRPRSPP